MAFLQEELTPISQTLSTTLLSTAHIPVDNSLNLFVNGVFQRPSIDFSLTDNNIEVFEVLDPSYSTWASYEYHLTSMTPEAPSGMCEDRETILPSGRSGSTTINSAVTSFELLGERIKMQLGFPVVRIELCDDQIYDFIDQAIEWYSKYAGYTEEYLVFDSSKVYQCGLGVKLDNIFSAHACYHCCGDESHLADVTSQFYDCDLNNYRKVVDVKQVDPVAATATDTLFTLDYLYAQQTYYSYLLGGFGFDLTTWHILKEWLDLRKKMFATDPYVRFDKRTQYLKIIPEPTRGRSYLGVISCYVEQPISWMVQERWVFQYALALTKIATAHIRGKYGQVQLFGGGGPHGTDLMVQGVQEKQRLEEELMNNYGETKPIDFLMG